jgi:oxygen-independent coproporphyrinogen-3 oxidase
MSGIYIHFPFCTKKCIYCNFYSTTSLTQKDAYIKALQKEIIQSTDYLSDVPIRTLYFGGGTPSLLSIKELSIILETLKLHYFFDKNLEFTFEANPETLTLEYLKSLRELGINRISIGIQSFHDSILHFLNRRHHGEEAQMAIKNALNAGFDNISIDLIMVFRSEQIPCGFLTCKLLFHIQLHIFRHTR